MKAKAGGRVGFFKSTSLRRAQRCRLGMRASPTLV
jgi:hypothetical protein